MLAISRRWFPQMEPSEESMGEALWLERDYWEKMAIAVANGIAQAFKG